MPVVRAVTLIVTVTVPPEAIVTLPAKALLVTALKVLVVALALTLLLMPLTLNSAGIVSLMLPVSVDGPAFVTTSVKLVVPPTATVVEPTVLLGVMLTAGKTLSTAVAVDALVPTDVVKEPEAIVLVKVPTTELVTTLVKVQLAPGGMSVPAARVNVPKFTVAVAVPGLQLVCAAEEKFTSPGGYTSVKSAETVAETRACVFVIVIVSSAVPPALIVLTEKALAIVGLDGETVSVSAAEQIPAPVQEPVELVFVTLTGGEIEAVLVI